MSASEIAASLNASLPRLKAGSLRFWGQWFGRPFDNAHRITRCRSDGDALILEFNEGETLIVRQPEGLDIQANTFSIAAATRVRWEWFYYGRPKTKENRYYEEYLHRGSYIDAATNADWYTPKLEPTHTEKAVEML